MAGAARKIIMAAATGLLASMAFAATAQAGCAQTTAHHTTSSTLPPLSSYFEHEAKLKAKSAHCTQSATVAHSATTLPPLASHFTTTHRVHAPTRHTVSYAPLSPTVISGLGQNEGLRPTTCPVAVHNPEGGRVLGCYNVVRRVAQPVTKTTYYRVVRPIIYVRYPVPVPVCRLSTCGSHHHHHQGGSRYGYSW
jgi:hypothetical protein